MSFIISESPSKKISSHSTDHKSSLVLLFALLLQVIYPDLNRADSHAMAYYLSINECTQFFFSLKTPNESQ